MSASALPLQVALLSESIAVAKTTHDVLEEYTARVERFCNASALRQHVSEGRVDLVIIDDTHDESEAHLLGEVAKARRTPFVYLNVHSEHRCASLLHSGADEAIPMRSPSTRIRLARAAARASTAGHRDRDLSLGDLRLDRAARKATLAGDELHLTSHEWDMLTRLLEEFPCAASTEALANCTNGSFALEKRRNRVQVCICTLRHKLAASTRLTIETVRGTGYRLLLDAGA